MDNLTGEYYSSKPTSASDFIAIGLYFVEGLIIICVNLLFGATIFSRPNLQAQKEYLLYAGCMAFDVIFGFTYCIASIYRFLLSKNYEYFPLLTMFGCVKQVHMLFFTYITPGSGILVLLTSFDRIFCVFFPVKYMQLRTGYVYALLATIFIVPLFFVAASVITSAPYNSEHVMTSSCPVNQSVTDDMYLVLRLVRVIASIFSFLVYMPIGFKIYQNVQASQKQQYGGLSKSSQGKLIRMTLTIVLITLNTLCLYAVPDLILLLNPDNKLNFFYILNLNKGMVNIVIFLTTQKSLRSAIMANLLRKSDSSSPWKKSKIAASEETSRPRLQVVSSRIQS